MPNPFSSGGVINDLMQRIPRVSKKVVVVAGVVAFVIFIIGYELYRYSQPTPKPPEVSVTPSAETWFHAAQVPPPQPPAPVPPSQIAPPPPPMPQGQKAETVDPIKARIEEMRIQAPFEQPMLNMSWPVKPRQEEKRNDVEKNKAVELTEVKRPQTPFEVKTGTVIPAVLMTGINSDLPGMIVATVRENVYDSVTGSHLLIPQGSKLIGQYQSDIRMGQNRVMIGFNKLQYPDGGTVDLQGIPASDPAGYAGFADQVDNHFWKIFGQSLLWAIINAGAQMGQNQGKYTFSNEDYGSQAQDELSASMQETADAILRRNLNIAPTLKIRPGYRFNIMVVNDLVFPGTYDGKF